ncbi:MAG: hypothetical protein JNL75_09955 [Chitinophagales bacterium]|nr:hypothetical protein [Chitinophagales bacterium]
MLNTVIGELYASFSESELKTLDIYLSTSHWQYSDTVIKCHNCLMHYRLRNELELLDKQLIFLAVYDDELYNDSKLRFLLNRLVEAIREFVISLEDKKGNVFLEKVWIDFLLDRKVKKNIQYNLEKKEIPSSVEYKFLQRYFKSQELNVNSFAFTKDVKQQFESIAHLMKNAELFSDLVFIKNYCSLISFSNVYRSIPVDLPTEKLVEIKNKHWELDHPEFLIYLNLLDLLINKNEPAYYYKYKNDLFQYLEIWNAEEKVNFLASLLNFTTNQINSGKVEFIDEQYELFTLFEERSIFDIKGYINAGRINNVVFIYLRKKQFKKAEDFIKKYTSSLPELTKESCRHFNLARIRFENAKYKESLNELLKVDFGHDAFYSLNSKLLLLKNYFELKESDAFDSLCSSFKEFIRKNKVVSDSYKTNYLNFIKMIRRIYQASPAKIKKLKKELELATQIAEKAWLLEKCKGGK